jgi:hypothetical protein
MVYIAKTIRDYNYLKSFLTKSGIPVELLCGAAVSFENVLSSSIGEQMRMGRKKKVARDCLECLIPSVEHETRFIGLKFVVFMNKLMKVNFSKCFFPLFIVSALRSVTSAL